MVGSRRRNVTVAGLQTGPICWTPNDDPQAPGSWAEVAESCRFSGLALEDDPFTVGDALPSCVGTGRPDPPLETPFPASFVGSRRCNDTLTGLQIGPLCWTPTDDPQAAGSWAEVA